MDPICRLENSPYWALWGQLPTRTSSWTLYFHVQIQRRVDSGPRLGPIARPDMSLCQRRLHHRPRGTPHPHLAAREGPATYRPEVPKLMVQNRQNRAQMAMFCFAYFDRARQCLKVAVSESLHQFSIPYSNTYEDAIEAKP